MSYTDHLSELEALRSQVADLSRALAERDQLMDVERRHHEGEIRDLREQSELLRSIVEGTATEAGNDCFASLVTHLTSTLQVQYAVIGEVSDGLPKKIRTVAVSAGGTLVDNFEYDLAHTPCATALAQTFACFSRDVQTTFPLFSCLADLGAESYCAVSLRAKDGSTIGLLVVMDTKPLENSDYLRSLLEVFAPRIAAEFERKQAERERAQALADLHNVIEAIPDIVFALDIQGNMMKWNRRVVDVTGYSPEELLNKPALAFVPPEEQDNTAAAIQRAFTEGYAELEGHLLTKDRRLIPYHWTGALLKNLHGEPIGITGVGRDVFDRKRAEEALRVSEERFALAVEGSSDILWDAHRLPDEPWYAPQTSIWWSPRVRNVLGLQESDSFETFEQWAARLHPEDKDRVFGQLAAHIEQRVPYDVEYRLRTNTGDYRWIRGRGQALWDEQGEPSRMSGSCQDITERKGVEEALRASEERWQLAVRGSNDGIWDWDIQSGTIFFSPRWKAMRGFGEYEIASRVEEWRSRIHSDDLDRVLQSLDAYLAKQAPDFCEEYRTQRKDGSYMWILDRGLALWAEDGTPLRMVGSESDITEHKQALLCLAEQESLLRSILDTEPECVNRVAEDGTILQMNKAGLCFIEADSFNQVAGRSVFDLVAPEFLERYRRMHEAVIRGASQQLEFQIVGLKGTRRWMETHAVSLRNPIDNRVEHLAITHDITERKRAEASLHQSEERYRSLVDNAPIGIFLNEAGRFVYANREMLRILKATSAELLIGTPVLDRIAPEFHTLVKGRIRELTMGQPVPSLDEKFMRLDGSQVDVAVSAIPTSVGANTVMQVLVLDITERKQLAEREVARVRQLKKLYELSMTLSGDSGVVLEHAVRIIGELFKVPVVCLSEIVGQELYFKAVYINGQTFMDAGHCSLAITPCAMVEQTKDLRIFDRVMEHFPEASFLRDHQAVSYCGFPALDSDGRVVAVTCLMDNKPHDFSKEEQDLLRIFGQRIATEIERSRHTAEQKRAEKELRKSHAFIRQIIDTDPNFIFAKDREGRFTLANKAVADAYGTTVENLIGKTDADFNFNQGEVAFFRQSDLAVMDTLRELFLPEEVITDSGGRTRWLQTVKRPILDDEGRATMVLGASSDITERKRMEETLRQRERSLQAAIEERERISQDLHDGILQSLFAVGLALESAKLTMHPRNLKMSRASLNQAIDQLNDVMREIRNFIAGMGSDLLQGKDLPAALKQILASLTEHQATRVRLAVEDRAAKALSTEQSLHLIRVIQEAVSNCVKHGHAQEARVSLKMLKRGVRLRVRDNGRGFNQGAAKMTGHGLANMAARARQIGGRFTILSKVNEGTSIVLDFPKEAADVSR